MALLAAPVVVVTAVAWPAPTPAVEGQDEEDIDTDTDGGPLVPGDELDGEIAFNGVVSYAVVGTGEDLVVGVQGDAIDTTLTVLDAESGTQLDYIDDANGLDPELQLSLDEGQEVTVEVRELGGQPGTFTISLEGP